MNFQDILAQANTFSDEPAYHGEQLEALYNIVIDLPKGSNIVEIGVEYGRSGFVLAQASKEKGHKLFLVDSYQQDDSARAKACVEQWRANYDLITTARLIVQPSTKANLPVRKIDFLHIDGDHTAQGVEDDMKRWIPRVKKGRKIAFHDYGLDSLPEVYPTVNGLTKELGIKHLYTVNTTGVFEKI